MLNSSNFLLNIEIYVFIQHFTARIFVEFYENYLNILSNFSNTECQCAADVPLERARQYCRLDWKALLPLELEGGIAT